MITQIKTQVILGGIFLIVLTSFISLHAQWARTYGGSEPEFARSIQQTSDGGYIVAGYTESFGAGGEDFFVLKLSSDGNIDPSCGLVGGSDATIADTSVSPEDTNIIPGDLNASFQETSASPQDTDAIVYLICPAQEYTLTVNAALGGTTDPAPGNYTYAPGTHVTIDAVPEVGYRFSSWGADKSGQDKQIKINMDKEKTITPNFIRQYTLTIAAGTGGTTRPPPGTYTHDFEEDVSVEAVANDGYQFSGWSGAASGTTNPIVIRMGTDKSITANFDAINKEDDSIFELPCFIATAAYASPLHPHVKIMRDFRDKYLMSNKLGQKFVDSYYKYSPHIAKFIAKHKPLKIVTKHYLLIPVAFSYSMVYLGSAATVVIGVFLFSILIFIVFLIQKRFESTGIQIP